MKRYIIYSVLFCSAVLFSMEMLRPADGATLSRPLPVPAFTHTKPGDWLNSAPLTWKDLRGKVVLVDFWTFECWNCYRSFPWLRDMEARLEPEGLQVIGVHSPEFDREKVKSSIEAKIREFMLHHPVMIDNDHSYWRAMGNRYWPAYYIVDKQGRIRAVFYGETHRGDRQAKQIETTIRDLLQES
jgi:thiol-disulfide isomerase/thioredoxin